MKGKYSNMKSSNKYLLITTSILFVIVVILCCYLGFYFSNMIKTPFNLTVNQKEISINGWGNATIPLNSIESIQLTTSPLNASFNDGGGEMGNKIFGDEHLSNYGSTKCFIENLNEKAIYLKTTNKAYVINFNSEENTIALYNKLKDSTT